MRLVAKRCVHMHGSVEEETGNGLFGENCMYDLQRQLHSRNQRYPWENDWKGGPIDTLGITAPATTHVFKALLGFRGRGQGRNEQQPQSHVVEAQLTYFMSITHIAHPRIFCRNL